MKLYAVFFLTCLKPDTVNHQNLLQKLYRYGIRGVSLSSGWKVILKAEHSMLKLKILNQTHFLSNVVYHNVTTLGQFCFWYISVTCPIVYKRQILEHLLMTPLYFTLAILYRTLKKLYKIGKVKIAFWLVETSSLYLHKARSTRHECIIVQHMDASYVTPSAKHMYRNSRFRLSAIMAEDLPCFDSFLPWLSVSKCWKRRKDWLPVG